MLFNPYPCPSPETGEGERGMGNSKHEPSRKIKSGVTHVIRKNLRLIY